MTSLLILTVGTGTAGKHSDVASGLARTLDLCTPRLFWLVPPASEKTPPPGRPHSRVCRMSRRLPALVHRPALPHHHRPRRHSPVPQRAARSDPGGAQVV